MLTPLSRDAPKPMRRWHFVRARGRTSFILRYGVLGYGLFFFLTMTFVLNRPSALSVIYVAQVAVVWAALGASVAWINWHFSEKAYQEYLAELDLPQPGK